MVIKYAKKMKCLSPFLITALMTLCKLYVRLNYLQGFHLIAISENASKYDISDSKEDTYRRVPLQQIWML